MMTNRNPKADLMIAGGLLLLAAALCIILCYYKDESRAADYAESIVRQIQERTMQMPQSASSRSDGANVEEREKADCAIPETNMPVLEIEGNLYVGTIELPSLDIILPVMSEWNYAKLKLSPCCFSGSVYLDDMIIAGHNYSGHFGSLKDLNPGDEIVFTDAEGNTFFYAVTELQQLDAAELQALIAGNWDLTLFTCTFDGGDRVVVRCERQKDRDF